VVDRSPPDQRPINAEVLVNQNIPQAHDIAPWHGVVSRCDCRAQSGDCFTDDRQLLSDGVAESLVGEEFGLCSTGDSFRDPVQRIQDIVSLCGSRRID
jgi:hypothetical protein